MENIVGWVYAAIPLVLVGIAVFLRNLDRAPLLIKIKELQGALAAGEKPRRPAALGEAAPNKAQIKDWLNVIEEFSFEWISDGRRNLIYDDIWVDIFPFLSEDTVEEARKRRALFDALIYDPKAPIPHDHLRRLLRRDLKALLRKAENLVPKL